METIRREKTFAKGTTRLFRLLFSDEERQGRSLLGKPYQGKVRPALEDQDKVRALIGRHQTTIKIEHTLDVYLFSSA